MKFFLALALLLSASARAAVSPVLSNCSTDDLSGVAASSGYWDANFACSDIQPLCSGWVLLADKTNNRVLLVDVVRGLTATAFPLSTAPYQMAYDPDNGFAWVSTDPATFVTKIDLQTGVTTNISATNYTTQITAGDGHAWVLTGDQWSTRLEQFSGLTNALENTQTAYYYGALDYNTATNVLMYWPTGISSGDFSRYDFSSPPNLNLSYTANVDGYGSTDTHQSPDSARYTSGNIERSTSDGTAMFGSFDSNTITYSTSEAYRPQGGLFARSDDTHAGLYDSSTHVQLAIITPTASSSPNAIQKVRFSRGGQLLLMMQQNSSTGTRVQWRKIDPLVYLTPTLTPTPAASAPVWIGCNSDSAASGPSSGLRTLAGPALDMVALCDGWVVVALSATNELCVIHAPSGAIQKRIQLNAAPLRLSYDPAEGVVYAALRNSTYIAKADLNSGSVSYLRTNFPAAGVAAGNCGTVFASTIASPWWDSLIEVFDSAGAKASNYAIGYESDLAYDHANDRVLATATDISSYDAWTLSYDSGTKTLSPIAHATPVGAFYAHPVVSADGSRWSFGPRSGGAVENSMSPLGSVLGLWSVAGSSAYDVAYSPSGALVSIVDGSKLQISSASSHATLVSYSSGLSSLQRTAYSRGGKLAYGLDYLSSGSSPSRIFWVYHGQTDGSMPSTPYACTTFSPTPPPSSTSTVTPVPSPTDTPTGTPTATQTRTTSPTPSTTQTGTPSPTYSITATNSPTFSASATSSSSPTLSVTRTPSLTATISPTMSTTSTPSPNPTAGGSGLTPLLSPSPEPTIPAADQLLAPYPNPYQPGQALHCGFVLSIAGPVTLTLYDLKGQTVRILASGLSLGAGQHSIDWDGDRSNASGVASGIYYLVLKTDKAHEIRRVIVTR